jgi:hypothetical protein
MELFSNIGGTVSDFLLSRERPLKFKIKGLSEHI